MPRTVKKDKNLAQPWHAIRQIHLPRPLSEISRNRRNLDGKHVLGEDHGTAKILH
jgi:hypothetical protein